MPIQYQIENTPEYLLITASGSNVDIDEVMGYTQAVVESAIKYNSKCVLCDERELPYTLSMYDTTNLAEYASQYSKLGVKVALVCNKKYMAEGRFYETEAINRGLVLRVTDDYQSVLEWFKEP